MFYALFLHKNHKNRAMWRLHLLWYVHTSFEQRLNLTSFEIWFVFSLILALLKGDARHLLIFSLPFKVPQNKYFPKDSENWLRVAPFPQQDEFPPLTFHMNKCNPSTSMQNTMVEIKTNLRQWIRLTSKRPLKSFTQDNSWLLHFACSEYSTIPTCFGELCW